MLVGGVVALAASLALAAVLASPVETVLKHGELAGIHDVQTNHGRARPVVGVRLHDDRIVSARLPADVFYRAGAEVIVVERSRIFFGLKHSTYEVVAAGGDAGAR